MRAARAALLLAASALQPAGGHSVGSNSSKGIQALAELFPLTVVLCYNETCAPHSEGGGFWTKATQDRVVVLDGAVLDAGVNRDLLSCMFDGFGQEGPRDPHRFAPTLSHWAAIELAAQNKVDKVLVLEADARDTIAAADVARNRPQTWRQALNDTVAGEWDVLRLNSNVHPPNRPFEKGCSCSKVEQIGRSGLLPKASMTTIKSRADR